jgi:predicted MFS family arabinose efflux permease
MLVTAPTHPLGCSRCDAYGRSKQVDRNFSFYLICQLVFAAAALQWMPTFSIRLGVGGVFALLATLFAMALLLLRYLPSANESSSGHLHRARAGSAAWIGLAATLIYFVAQGAVWAYLELIGERGGIGRQAVATGVAVSTLVGLAGPTTAAALGPRFGRVAPLFVGLCMSLAALYLLSSSLDSIRFVGAACLFNVAWNFIAPYQIASIAAADRSGRVVGWAASASLAGLAIGPLVAALALDAASFAGVLWLSAGLCILSFVGFIPALSKTIHAA